jgi:hypothetical protein
MNDSNNSKKELENLFSLIDDNRLSVPFSMLNLVHRGFEQQNTIKMVSVRAYNTKSNLIFPYHKFICRINLDKDNEVNK